MIHLSRRRRRRSPRSRNNHPISFHAANRIPLPFLTVPSGDAINGVFRRISAVRRSRGELELGLRFWKQRESGPNVYYGIHKSGPNVFHRVHESSINVTTPRGSWLECFTTILVFCFVKVSVWCKNYYWISLILTLNIVVFSFYRKYLYYNKLIISLS
jgi:hypothetical protein